MTPGGAPRSCDGSPPVPIIRSRFTVRKGSTSKGFFSKRGDRNVYTTIRTTLCAAPLDRRTSIDLPRAHRREIDEQKSAIRIERQVAERVEHVVAAIIGKRDLRRALSDESGLAAAMRCVGVAVRIHAGNEECRLRTRLLMNVLRTIRVDLFR